MSITREDVEHVAHLARLGLDDDPRRTAWRCSSPTFSTRCR